jgi:hypothetical protein
MTGGGECVNLRFPCKCTISDGNILVAKNPEMWGGSWKDDLKVHLDRNSSIAKFENYLLVRQYSARDTVF